MEFLSDLRVAFRTLVQRPAFAFVAVATLGLGSGLNTAIFSVLNAALLRPLPYQAPDRSVMMYGRAQNGDRQGVSEPDLQDLTRSSR